MSNRTQRPGHISESRSASRHYCQRSLKHYTIIACRQASKIPASLTKANELIQKVALFFQLKVLYLLWYRLYLVAQSFTWRAHNWFLSSAISSDGHVVCINRGKVVDENVVCLIGCTFGRSGPALSELNMEIQTLVEVNLGVDWIGYIDWMNLVIGYNLWLRVIKVVKRNTCTENLPYLTRGKLFQISYWEQVSFRFSNTVISMSVKIITYFDVEHP